MAGGTLLRQQSRNRTNRPPRLPPRYLALLGCLLALAGFVRFYDIAGPSLWEDELVSMQAATGRGVMNEQLRIDRIQTRQAPLISLQGAPAWPHIVTTLAGVTHPPLYFLLLRWWMDLFGQGAAAARGFSAIASLAAIPVLFDICRLLHGPRRALLAAAIMAISVGQIDYAQDARSYALLMLLALGCADALVRIEILGATARRLVALAALLLATALTHYLAVGTLLAFLAYAALRLRAGDRRAALLMFAIAAAASLALCAPIALAQGRVWSLSKPGFVAEISDGSHLSLTLRRLVGLPGELVAGQAAAAAADSAILIAAAVVLYIAPAIRLRAKPELLLWVLWIIGAVGFLLIFDVAHGTMLLRYPRYAAIAAPAMCAILAAIQWPNRSLVRDTAAWGALAILAIVLAQRLEDGAPTLEDWRSLSRQIEAGAGPHDLLVFANTGIPASVWYVNFMYYAPGSQRPWLILDGPAGPDLLRQINQRRTLWLIGLYPDAQGPALLPGWVAGYTIRTSAGCACQMIRPDAIQNSPAR